MSSFEFSVKADIKRIQRSLNEFANRQVPFATAMALTSLGKLVQAEETASLSQVFDRPTPFTLKSIGVKAARKGDLRAIVFVKDIAAKYLEPFEFNGVHKLVGSGKTWLNPKDMTLLNQYGNLSKNKLAQLRGRPDVFIGKVKTKSGEVIDGVWQRPHVRVNQSVRGKTRMRAGSNSTGHLKLLIRFGDALPVRHRMNYRARAQMIINSNVDAEFGKALAKAMATAKA